VSPGLCADLLTPLKVPKPGLQAGLNWPAIQAVLLVSCPYARYEEADLTHSEKSSCSFEAWKGLEVR